MERHDICTRCLLRSLFIGDPRTSEMIHKMHQRDINTFDIIIIQRFLCVVLCGHVSISMVVAAHKFGVLFTTCASRLGASILKMIIFIVARKCRQRHHFILHSPMRRCQNFSFHRTLSMMLNVCLKIKWNDMDASCKKKKKVIAVSMHST